MGALRTHRDLEVWKNSVELVTDVYKITEAFPKYELFGLSNQMRRAAVSIPSNIAEGAGRFHDNEFVQFLYIASGDFYRIATGLKSGSGFLNQQRSFLRIPESLNRQGVCLLQLLR